MQIEKTVFISYRRTNAMHARAVYQALKSQGYDCFLDFQNIDAGAFEQIIISQIKARAHFVLILTPSALERCNEPGDWLRREIETAMDYKRNIVPLMMDGFDYKSPIIRQALTGKLEVLSGFNALTVHTDYFDEAMARLANRFLNKPVDAILYPILSEHKAFINENIIAADNVTKVTSDELRAAEWFESGFAKYDKGDFAGAIEDYTRSIQLNPKQHLAFFNRGLAKGRIGNKPAALMDYTQASLIQPDYVNAYYQRGIVRGELGDIDGEIEDYTTAIRYDPQFYLAYNNRAAAYMDKKLYDNAVDDANQAILIKPDYADAFYNRGLAMGYKGDKDAELNDYTAAIGANANYDKAYYNRALIYFERDELQKAFDDYTAVIRLHDRSGGNEQTATTALSPALLASAYRNRGVIYERWNNIAAAISDFEKHLAFNPPDADAVLTHIANLRNQQNIGGNNPVVNTTPTSASEYFDRAFKKFEEADFAGAIEDYTQVIQLDPTDHVAWYNRGLARWNLRQNDEAIADYTQAIKLKPDYARAFYNRAIVRGAKGDLQGEIDDYTESIRLDPKYHQAYNNRAATFIDMKQFDLAIMDANQAIWLKEDYTDAYYNRGLAKKNMGDVSGALADYNKALEINPDYNKAYRSRGIIYEERGDLLLAKADYENYVRLGGIEPDKIRGWIAEIDAKLAGGASGIGDPNQMTAAQLFKRAFEKHEQGDYNGSIEDYSAVLEINPDDHIVWYNRGLGYYRIDENEKAEADYTRCIELNPNYINAYYNRGLARKRLGNSAGAMDDYDETIRRDANYINVYRARGIIYEDNGEFAKAIADYKKYIELGGAEADKIKGWIAEVEDKMARMASGQYPVTPVGGMTSKEYFDRAYAKHDQGDFEGSVADYSEALKLNPSDHLAWYNRGLGYYNLKRNAEAIADYSECIRINPEYINAYYNRGLARNRNGDKTGALLDYNETIRRKADYVNAYRARGIIYEEMGDYDRAISDYEKYIELNGGEPDKIRGWINEVIAKKSAAGGSVFGGLTAEQFFDRAYNKHENGDYAGAIADYTQAIKLKPHDHLAWYNRGLGHYFLNQHSQAILDYTESIRLNPEYVNAYYNRGLARNRNGDKSGAMDDYNETIRRKADYINAYRARGILFEDLGDTTRAVADYQKYIELGGTDADKVRGWIDAIKQKIASGNQNPPPRPKPTIAPDTDPFENIHLHDGMFRSADDPPEDTSGYVGADGKIRWTKLDSGNGGVMSARQYFDRAFKKHDAGDFAGSVADYSEALKLNSRDHLAWYNRGLGYYNLGKHSQAISDYTECIRLNPEYINAYYNRGLARSKNGDAAGALADYNETLRRNPQYVNAYRARGIIYEDNGDFAKAIADYSRYIELGGSEPDKIRGWIKEVEEKLRKR